MPKFIVLHGSLKTETGVKTVGDSVELDEKFVKQQDPHGVLFATPEQFAAIQKKVAAEEELEALTKKKNAEVDEASLKLGARVSAKQRTAIAALKKAPAKAEEKKPAAPAK